MNSTSLWHCLSCCKTWFNFWVCGWNPKSVTIQMKATEQYVPVALFIMLYNAVLTFESVDEILKCDHSNESYWAVLSCGTVYYAVQRGSNFWVCGSFDPKVWSFKWELQSWVLSFGAPCFSRIRKCKFDIWFLLCAFRVKEWFPAAISPPY